MAGSLDLAIIGAGPAGIAAARSALARGLSVLVLEARARVGGRVLTAEMQGRALDLGAHWLHAGPINPVVRLARGAGWRLRRAPTEAHLFRDGRRASGLEARAYAAAFDRADHALNRCDGLTGEADQPALSLLPALGPWRRPVAAITGLVAGRNLGEISARDFASAEYADNLFATDGFGAIVARLARGLPIRLETAVTAVEIGANAVRLETARGMVAAGAAVVTVPPLLLQRGAIRFTPALTPQTEAAIAGFKAGIYEHVVLDWPDAPFAGADRIATLTGVRLDGVGLLTRIEGGPLHYLELDQVLDDGLGAPRGLRAGLLVREMLARQFGHRDLARLRVRHVTDWRGDPLSGSSWSVVPPGQAGIREAIARPVRGRLAFAGEMADHAQWGTVGGAWASGERAVAALFDASHPLRA